MSEGRIHQPGHVAEGSCAPCFLAVRSGDEIMIRIPRILKNYWRRLWCRIRYGNTDLNFERAVARAKSDLLSETVAELDELKRDKGDTR